MNVELQNLARRKIPAWLIIPCAAGIIAGAIGLAITFATSPRQGWMWLVVNFVIYWGAASGILSWAAAFRVAQARWTSAVNRLAHSALSFMPVLVILLVVLIVGARAYMPWVEHPVRGKEAWLNVPAFAVREIIAALLFWTACWLLVRWSLAADAKSEITDRDHHRINVVAVIAVAAYAITATIIAWDFIMSLSPMWTSTMFSVYYFTTSSYMGLAALVLMATGFRKPLGIEDKLKPNQFHDMGNLLLAFSLFNMGLFFAQYLTIWYENLPDESAFLIVRYVNGEWAPFAWAAFIIGYAIPFLLLQSRKIKLTPWLLCIVAASIELGVGMERFVLVAPSLERKLIVAPFGALSLLGFFGAFLLCRTAFLARYSPISKADEVLAE